METIDKLLVELRHLDIRIWVDGKDLRYQAPKNNLTPIIRKKLIEHKTEIITLLLKTKNTVKTNNNSRVSYLSNQEVQPQPLLKVQKPLNQIKISSASIPLPPKNQSIKSYFLKEDESLPLIIEPQEDNFDWISWIKKNIEFIKENLYIYGGIIFRNFNINSVSDFKKLTLLISPNLLEDPHRQKVNQEINQIYHPYFGGDKEPGTFTDALGLHNENSFSDNHPLKIWFFCLEPAKQGGETILADCRKILECLDPDIVNSFLVKKIMYIKNIYNSHAFFQTKDKSVIENYCSRHSIDFEWKGENFIRLYQLRNAVLIHPETQEKVWFNQAHLWHKSVFEQTEKQLTLNLSEVDLPHNVLYGDFLSIPDSVIDEIRQAFEINTVTIPLQKGDCLLLDNMLSAHGRKSFMAPRKILVAMSELYKPSRLNTFGAIF